MLSPDVPACNARLNWTKSHYNISFLEFLGSPDALAPPLGVAGRTEKTWHEFLADDIDRNGGSYRRSSVAANRNHARPQKNSYFGVPAVFDRWGKADGVVIAGLEPHFAEFCMPGEASASDPLTCVLFW